RGRPARDGRPRGPPRAHRRRAVAARCARLPRHRRPRRGAGAARCARPQARAGLDEPRRAGRHGVRARRPVHRLRRPRHRLLRSRRRQDAAADRPRRPRERRDHGGVRARRRRARRARAGRARRAVLEHPGRRAGPQRPLPRRRHPVGHDRLGPRAQLRLHLAEAARGAGDGPRAGRDHVAGAAAGRRGRAGPGRGPALARRGLAARGDRSRGRSRAAVPAGRRRRRRRRPGGGAAVTEHVVRAGSTGRPGVVTDVTPETAGWAWSGLLVQDLDAGARLRFDLTADEGGLLPLRGDVGLAVTASAGERTTVDLAGRAEIWHGPVDFAYLPLGSTVEVVAGGTGARVALTRARAERTLPLQVLRSEEVPTLLRGAGACSRQVHNYTIDSGVEVERMLVCEVYTPGGNTSGYPPHKHDTHSDVERELEEIYYFEVADTPGGPGMAYHRNYGTPER